MPWASSIKGFDFCFDGTFATHQTDMGVVAVTNPINYGNYAKTATFAGQADTVQVGWVTIANIAGNDRVASPTEGTQFASSQRTANSGASNPQQFRIDLPDAGGTYQISVAFGSCNSTETSYFSILDGTTTIAGPFGPITTTAHQYAGADGNVVSSPASYAAWVAATFVVTRTFTDTGGPGGTPRLFINAGDPAHAGSGNTTIAHVRVVQGGAASTPPLIMPTRRYIQTDTTFFY